MKMEQAMSKELMISMRTTIDGMGDQFQNALPKHISVEKFKRVVMTAINSDMKLLSADKTTLISAAMKAAQDGLLPDGREATFAIFNTKKDNAWVNTVQYMPMYAGILKKIRNSGELETISANVVYANDFFEYVLGDNEEIIHKPLMRGDRGDAIGVYAIAKTKAGGIFREVMTFDEIEKVRAVSRAAKSGPWVTWWSEMARKTVIRRLAKRLPMSTDLDDLIRQDDDLSDFKAKTAPTPAPEGVAKLHTLDDFAGVTIDNADEPKKPEKQTPPEKEKLRAETYNIAALGSAKLHEFLNSLSDDDFTYLEYTEQDGVSLLEMARELSLKTDANNEGVI
jgi:recombination protein RecT